MPLPFIIGGLAALGSAIGAGAAAAGTAVAGAAAAGAAVAGTAAAAVGGTVAAVGTAAAGTAVGGAVIGTMGAVGTGVAGAAAAVSSAPIIGAAATTVAHMAGTAAGATALGTVTTTGAIGAVSGISGAAKLSEASEIKDKAMEDYNFEKENLERIHKWTNNTLKDLGKEKLKIWGSFERFSTTYSKIQNPPVMNGYVNGESLTLTQDELDNVKAVALSAKDVMSMGISSVAAGNLISYAATGGLASTLTVASTGTAITSLSGAAATNATLAALGGGALSAGGAGMAGGATLLYGLAITPALMVGGIMLNGKGNKALENARDIKYEANKAIEKMKTAEEELQKVQDLAKQIQDELRYLNRFYTRFMDEMEGIVARKTNYRMFTYEEKKSLEKTVLALKLLKQLSMQNILDPQKENVILAEDVNRTLECVSTARRERLAA